MSFVTDCQRGSLLGSKSLGTKCIRTTSCIVLANQDKTMSLDIGLFKVHLSVSLNRVIAEI